MAHIVDTLVRQIEDGAGEWHMPWTHNGLAGLPYNASTLATYRGGNIVWLWMAALDRGYTNPRWATYKQWSALGAQVRKGEKATLAMVWKPIEPKDDDDTKPKRGFYRAFPLFNTAQVDGDPLAAAVPDELELDIFMPTLGFVPATIIEGNPSYDTKNDVVRMPPHSAFDNGDAYFATLAHELGHWTGHSTRLNREYGKRFGDEAYAAEELVAEMSAAFTCATFAVPTVERLDHAAYLEHWIKMLKATPDILFTVASKAQAATDHLLSHRPAMEAAA
jgi:antirestriction protein ArdC